MSDFGFQAYVSRDRGSFALDTVVLYVYRRVGQNGEYLRADGLWQSVPEGQTHTESEIGMRLPAEAIEAIAVAIEEFQGHASHADTEARVLREWLAVETARVDEALGR
jgi:hypothetical protein